MVGRGGDVGVGVGGRSRDSLVIRKTEVSKGIRLKSILTLVYRGPENTD